MSWYTCCAMWLRLATLLRSSILFMKEPVLNVAIAN